MLADTENPKHRRQDHKRNNLYMVEYTYKLYRDASDELVVTVVPLVKDIERSIVAMMAIADDTVKELSPENRHLFEMKILGLRTIHQFLGALIQEQTLKDCAHELKGTVNIQTNQIIDQVTKFH